jgi:hypothetical protein
MYAVTKGLEKENRIRKDDNRWFPEFLCLRLAEKDDLAVGPSPLSMQGVMETSASNLSALRPLR